jgi:hypothetical protein
VPGLGSVGRGPRPRRRTSHGHSPRRRPTGAREMDEETRRFIGAGTTVRHNGDRRVARRHGDGPGSRRLWTAAVGTRAVKATARGARLSARRTRRGVVGTTFKPRARVWTEPPAAANHGSVRHDTATDRRAPRVSRISNLNKSPRMKIAQRK